MKTLSRVTLRHQAAVALWSEEDGQRDDIFRGGHSHIPYGQALRYSAAGD